MRAHWLRFSNAIAVAAWSSICGLAAAATDIATAPVPTVQHVIDRAMTAMGGREAIARVDSMCVHWEPPGRPGFTSECCFASGDRILIVDHRPNARNVHGSDGRVGWLEMYDREFFHQTFYGDTRVFKEMAFSRMVLPYFEDFLKGAERVESVEFNGAPAYRLTTPPGLVNWRAVYFSVDNGLPLGYSAIATELEPDAPARYMAVLDDWRPVGGLRFPHRIKIANPVAPGELVATAVEVNTIDPVIFTAPEKKPSRLPDQPMPKGGKLERPTATALRDISTPLTAAQIDTLSREEARQRMAAIARELQRSPLDPPARERLDREFKLLLERLRRLREPKQSTSGRLPNAPDHVELRAALADDGRGPMMRPHVWTDSTHAHAVQPGPPGPSASSTH